MVHWDLDSAESFAQRHKEILINVPVFKIGRHKWRFNEDEEFESAQPIEADEQYWEVEEWDDRYGNTKEKYHFDYVNCYNFLRNRGFGRLMMASGKYEFVHMDSRIVKIVEPYKIKDFVLQFTKEIGTKTIKNMLFRGAKMYLGPDSLS